LKSFFKENDAKTRFISIEVRRNSEPLAVDVMRGSQGNINVWNKSTAKTIDPPYFNEKFNATELDVYDRLFGSGSFNINDFQIYVNTVAEKTLLLKEKIERKIEFMCAEVFQTGICTFANGDNIDFGRKSASIVTKPVGQTWNVSGVSPYNDLEAGCEFLRTVGKASGGVFYAIMGKAALQAFLDNDVVQKRDDLKSWQLDNLHPSQRDSLGMASHGIVSCGSWQVVIMTYPEYYTDANGDMQPYIADNNVILLPSTKPNFSLTYALPPLLVAPGTNTNSLNIASNGYYFDEFRDNDNYARWYKVRACAVPVPVAVDTIYTLDPLTNID
jgi:hypothetical protein